MVMEIKVESFTLEIHRFASVACTVKLWQHYSAQFLGIEKTNHARLQKILLKQQ